MSIVWMVTAIVFAGISAKNVGIVTGNEKLALAVFLGLAALIAGMQNLAYEVRKLLKK